MDLSIFDNSLTMFQFSSLDTGSRQFIISFLADFSNCLVSPLILALAAPSIRNKFFFLNLFNNKVADKDDG